MNKVYHADQHDLDLKKIGAGIKKTTKKVSTGIKKTTKNVVESVKKAAVAVGHSAELAKLAIFKPVMMNMLKAKNIPPSGDLDELADQFYRYIIKKEKYIPKKNIAPALIAAIPMIVEAIINWMKKAKEKKDSGEKLTKEEEMALEQTKKVADAVEKAESEDRSKDYIKYAIAAAALILILIMMKKSSK